MSEERDFENRLRVLERQFDRFSAHFTSELGNWTNIMNEVTEQLKKIRQMIIGNGEKGINDKVRDLWDEHEIRKKSSQGYLDWTFRGLIMMAMTYVVWKVTGWR